MMTALTATPTPASVAGPTLRRAREKTLFQLSPLPIFLVSYPEGRFLDVNDAFVRELGLEAETVIGRCPLDLDIWQEPADRKRLLEALTRRRRVDGWMAWIYDAWGRARAIELHAERMTIDGEECTLIAGLDVSQAYYDGLTGLPNRKLIEHRLERGLELQRVDGELTAVLFIDLDRLKVINDSLGHWAGDELLRAVAERSTAALGAGANLGRFGGDELVAVLRVGEAQQAVAAAERLSEAVRQPLSVGRATLRPSVSVGVAVATGGEASEDLLRHADVAMYRAKRNGHGVELFDRAVDEEAMADNDLERELALAFDRCQLSVHYQPIVRTADLSVWGAEALARWNHPAWGWVPPSRFIALAEATGQIFSLGREILYRACRQAAAWRRQETVDPDFVISVNVSALQLADDRFVADVAEVLEETGLPAANLQLEITERHAVAHVVAVEPLEALGIRLAIDDFGEGYGCLAYLRTMPVEVLKVDRGFVRDLPDSAIDHTLMRTMVELADGLARDIIAEGVETAEQLRTLRQVGCPLAQGYLFGEPLPADEMEEVMACRHPGPRLAQLSPPATAASTAWSSSPAENGFDRKGVSAPSELWVASTSSR